MTHAALQERSDCTNPIEILGQLLHENMTEVNGLIIKRMDSHVPMIPQLAGYLIAAGGKRIRPLLTLACAKLCDDLSENVVKMAASVEFIHTATLLHDDVVDGSNQRRGKATANEVFGNQASVLVGDFLFARAFELMVETNSISALNSLAKASATITEGEVLQMSLVGETNISRQQYFNIIEAKTAALFAAACEVAPLLQNKDATEFRAYGYHLGMAFQITDDVLDYTSPKMGKNKGDDFLEGKITLPVIIAIEKASDKDRELIINMIKSPSDKQLNSFINLLNKYNAFTDTMIVAQEFSNKATESLSKYSGETANQLMAIPRSILSRVS